VPHPSFLTTPIQKLVRWQCCSELSNYLIPCSLLIVAKSVYPHKKKYKERAQDFRVHRIDPYINDILTSVDSIRPMELSLEHSWGFFCFMTCVVWKQLSYYLLHQILGYIIVSSLSSYR